MKTYLYIALALVGWSLMLASSPRAANVPSAVPGTADIEPASVWYLMLPPLHRLTGLDTTAPLSHWTKIGTFATEEECHARASEALVSYHSKKEAGDLARLNIAVSMTQRHLKEEKSSRCIASDDPHHSPKTANP